MLKPFLIGAFGYPFLELLYRGRSHYSMALAGGISSMLISRVRKLPLSIPSKALLCGGGITFIEYLCGYIWNRDFQVWDYRNVPMNYQGQICLPYTLLWCFLSGGLLCLQYAADKKKPGS